MLGLDALDFQTYFALGSCEAIKRGKGMHSIIISEVMLNTALVIR